VLGIPMLSSAVQTAEGLVAARMKTRKTSRHRWDWVGKEAAFQNIKFNNGGTNK
jgi:hypothetical protein